MSVLGCNKVVYVPVVSVRTEYRDNYRRDSLYLRDSIFIRERGDTVWIEKYRYLYRDKLIKDSVIINDTIRVPYPVEVSGKGSDVFSWRRLLVISGVGIVFYWLYIRFFRRNRGG
jgi:hypothetical protein